MAKVSLEALTPTLFNTVQELKEAFNQAGVKASVTVDADIGANIINMSIYDGDLNFSIWPNDKGVVIRPSSGSALIRSVFNSIITEDNPYIAASTDKDAIASGIEAAPAYAARIMKLAKGA